MRKSMLLVALTALLSSAAAQAETCPEGKVCAPKAAHQPTSQQQPQAHKVQQPLAVKENRVKPSKQATQKTVKANNKPKAKPHHAPGLYVVAAKKLNVRATPQLRSPIVGALPRGEKVNVIEIESGWAKIVYRGRVNWVSATYLHR